MKITLEVLNDSRYVIYLKDEGGTLLGHYIDNIPCSGDLDELAEGISVMTVELGDDDVKVDSALYRHLRELIKELPVFVA